MISDSNEADESDFLHDWTPRIVEPIRAPRKSENNTPLGSFVLHPSSLSAQGDVLFFVVERLSQGMEIRTYSPAFPNPGRFPH